MMTQALQHYQPKHDFLVCIDSDGCVFDTMEIKHKEGFCPAMIDCWNLQSISKYAREAFEYVNLYSIYRGVNRFPAFLKALELVSDRPEVKRRGFTPPDVSSVKEWLAVEPSPSHTTLAAYCENHPGDAALQAALAWSGDSNAAIHKIVRGVPPFAFARESLQKIAQFADIVVVSATSYEALQREWQEHDLAQYTSLILGQEHGNKSHCIATLTEHLYSPEKTLMMGDAPGDHKAAQNNKVAFYPIVPASEDDSWERFFTTACDLFASGHYTAAYQEGLLTEFYHSLPTTPPWSQA